MFAVYLLVRLGDWLASFVRVSVRKRFLWLTVAALVGRTAVLAAKVALIGRRVDKERRVLVAAPLLLQRLT